MEAQLRRLPELESNSNSTILQIEMSNDQTAPASSSSSSSKPATSSRIILPSCYVLADKSQPSILPLDSQSTADNNITENQENSNNSKNVSDKNGPKKNAKKKNKKKKKSNKKKLKDEKKTENPSSSSTPMPTAGADISDTDEARSWTDSISDRCADISGSNSDISDNDELAISVNKPVKDVNVVIQPGAKSEIVEINRSDSCANNNGRKVNVRKLTSQKLNGQTGRVMNGYNSGKNNNRFAVWQEKGKKSSDSNSSNLVVKEQNSNKQSNKTENNNDSNSKEQQSSKQSNRIENNNCNLVVKEEQQSNKTENNNDNHNNSNSFAVKEQSNRTEIWVRSKEGQKINGSKSESGKVLNSQEPKPDFNNNNSNSNQVYNNFRRGRQASKKNNNTNNNLNTSNSNGVVIEELGSPVFKKDDFPIWPLSGKSNSKETQKNNKAGNRGNNHGANEKLPRGTNGSKKQSEKQVEKSESETKNKKPNSEIKAIESEEQSGPETQIGTKTLTQNPNLEIKTVEREEQPESETQTQTRIQIQNPNLETETFKPSEQQSESEAQIQSANSGSKTLKPASESDSETLTDSPNPNSDLQTLESSPISSSNSSNSNSDSHSNSDSNSNSDSKSCEDETNESNRDTSDKNTTTNESDAFNSYSSSNSSACSSPASISPISPVTDIIDHQTLISQNTDLDKIKDSVLSSLKTQFRVLQGFNTSNPFADYERFLNKTSPVLSRVPLLIPSCNCTENHNNSNNIDNLICCHEMTKMPLREIWRWYEEPGCYGLEVKGYDKYSCSDFKAHFVPYLSGMQLFAWPKKENEIKCESEEENETEKDESGSELANLPIFSKLLPKQNKEKEEGRNGSDSRNRSSDEVANGSESRNGSSDEVANGPKDRNGSEKNCGELAFEFFESEQPHNRMPIFEKIKQLIGLTGEKPSKGQMFGNPQILESVLIKDLHPSSWYSIAWYPAYRVPEGQFKAAFLTYHSLGHFITTQNNNNIINNMAINGGSVSLSVPVVGLQYYNDKGESWFDVRDQTAKSPSPNSPQNNLSELVRERLISLSQTSSVMARAKISKNGEISMNHHGDFEFFRSRSRPNYF